MASDAYACIAVFCLGEADLYSGDDLEICKIIATAYARASQVLPAELAEEHRSEVLV
jgi:3-methyladenine DNA glycosylase/8-oxoguanine DNA glycosylase